MTFPDDMEVDRDINCPHPGYPSLLEGQLQLGLSRRELKDIYEYCKVIVRSHRISFPPKKRERYGERLENSATLVLPLEELFPVLKRCKENWGAKWVLRKASSAVSLMDGQQFKKRHVELHQSVAEDRAATATADAAEIAAAAINPAPANGPPIHAPANPIGERSGPKLMYHRMRMHIVFTCEDDNTKYSDDKFKTEYDVNIEAGAIEEQLELAPIIQPIHHNFLASWMHPTIDVHRYTHFDDDDACAALFNESKSWLVSGSSSYRGWGIN